MVHLRVEQLVLHEQLADLGVQPLVLLIQGIRRAALQPRLTRGQELVTPLRGPRRRDPQFPRHRLEILAPQQAEYRRAFTPGRKPPPPVTLGGRSSRPPGALRRRRFLNLLPHLDTPPARTLSQSSVQENSRAQEHRERDAHRIRAYLNNHPNARAVQNATMLKALVGQETTTLPEALQTEETRPLGSLVSRRDST